MSRLESEGLRFVPTDITRFPLTTALRMVITGRSGSRAAFSSERVRGIAGLVTSTGTSITIWIFAEVIVAPCLRAASNPFNGVPNSMVKRCTIHAAGKLRVGADDRSAAAVKPML